MKAALLLGMAGLAAWLLWTLIQADKCGERWIGTEYQSRWTLRSGCQVSRDGYAWNRAPEVER